jgi:hypothetical protein
MSTGHPDQISAQEPPDPSLRATYLGVVVVEVIVLVALWIFSAAFGG